MNAIDFSPLLRSAIGFDRLARLMDTAHWDANTLQDLATVMADASICGLGQAAPNPLRCVIEFFPHEIGLTPSGAPA